MEIVKTRSNSIGSTSVCACGCMIDISELDGIWSHDSQPGACSCNCCEPFTSPYDTLWTSTYNYIH